MDATVAEVFCCTPLRVTLAECDRLQTLASAPAPPPAPTPGAATAAAPLRLPRCPNPDCPHRQELLAQRQQAGYWKRMHERARAREATLQDEIAVLQAKLRQREQQLFGRKAETTTTAAVPPALPPGAAAAAANPVPTMPPKPRPRGQQPGSTGHKRRDYSHLPAREEIFDLPQDQQRCAACGLPFAPFPGTEDVTILEVEVRAHRRWCRRRRYRPTCACGCQPGIVTAPPPPRLLAKSILGVSIWVRVLLDKFLFYRPTYRLLADLRQHGLDLALGTLTDGLQRLLPLFEPLYEKLVDRQRHQQHWHADETRWLVFVVWEGKVGHRWYLWAFRSADAVVFVLSPGRGHEVPEDHFGPEAHGILNVDRYAAYKAMAQVKAGTIVLAFCWAHVRRDFLEVARGWPAHEAWVLAWINRIGELYRRNDARLAVQDEPLAFAGRDQEVRAWVQELATTRDAELGQQDLHPARRQVLESLREHWTGLTVFVEHPHVPLDNNAAERIERGPVLGRKNYWGSGAKWSGTLAAVLFSLLQTLTLNRLNPQLWLSAYLQACAAAGGKPPTDVAAWLPWNLAEEQRRAWSLPAEPGDSS
jgi:transposase